MAPDRVVLQVDAGALDHERVAATVARLGAVGYPFAAFDSPSVEAVRGLPGFGLVRLDVGGVGADGVAARVSPFVAAGPVVHAVVVDSLGLFQTCVDAGCAGFQGRFRALPSIARTATVDPGALATAAEPLAPDMDFERLRPRSPATSG